MNTSERNLIGVETDAVLSPKCGGILRQPTAFDDELPEQKKADKTVLFDASVKVETYKSEPPTEAATESDSSRKNKIVWYSLQMADQKMQAEFVSYIREEIRFH